MGVDNSDNSLSPTKGKGPFRSDVKSDYYLGGLR
jgi:hypothetical protein